jgi:glycosyltransferase involved in cell wall biosynthesis
VLRVYHGGRDAQHRGRERALVTAGAHISLVVPSAWPDSGAQPSLSPEPFEVLELPVRRAGDVNRHSYLDLAVLRRVLTECEPDVLDIHEEPFSGAAHQWLRAAPDTLPIIMYSAQNIDKRFPPPFSGYERAAYRRVSAFYPCSRQAASVLRGKGFAGKICVLPLGIDIEAYPLGAQRIRGEDVILAFVGRLVPEKGCTDAVHVLARVHSERPTRLIVCGSGPEEGRVRALASWLGVSDRLDLRTWQPQSAVAECLRSAHVLLVPSRPTDTWAEQFGRVIVEAQASGALIAGYETGAVPEVAGEAGMIVRVGDVPAMAGAILRVLSTPDEFARRQESGRRLALERTWDAVARRQVALYRTVERYRSGLPPRSRSPRQRRVHARAEFGPTAPAAHGVRPYAVPGLRRGGSLARMLARAADTAAEVVAYRSP